MPKAQSKKVKSKDKEISDLWMNMNKWLLKHCEILQKDLEEARAEIEVLRIGRRDAEGKRGKKT